MANKLPLGESASINRPPLFCGENYQLWKIRMKFFVESIYKKFGMLSQMVLLFLCVKKFSMKNLGPNELRVKLKSST